MTLPSYDEFLSGTYLHRQDAWKGKNIVAAGLDVVLQSLETD